MKYKCNKKDCNYQTDNEKEMINHYLNNDTTEDQRIDILDSIVEMLY
jgi:hypothetical protein